MLVPRSCPQGWKVAHELQHLPRAQSFPQWWVLFALWSHLETAWNQWKCKDTPLLTEKLKWKSQLCYQSVWSLKGLWFPGCFSKLGEFLIFSTRGLPYCKAYSLPEGSELGGSFLTTQSTACKAPGVSCLPRGDVGLGAAPMPLQGGVTAASATETSIRQMKLRWKLRRAANAVLSILKLCPRYCKPQIIYSSLYMPQPANKCDQAIQSHFGITCLCKY